MGICIALHWSLWRVFLNDLFPVMVICITLHWSLWLVFLNIPVFSDSFVPSPVMVICITLHWSLWHVLFLNNLCSQICLFHPLLPDCTNCFVLSFQPDSCCTFVVVVSSLLGDIWWSNRKWCSMHLFITFTEKGEMWPFIGGQGWGGGRGAGGN